MKEGSHYRLMRFSRGLTFPVYKHIPSQWFPWDPENCWFCVL